MKHVCIINSSLKMSKGKIGRVCLHLGLRSIYVAKPDFVERWEDLGSIGVVLKATEEELFAIENKLKEENFNFVFHKDLGLTQVPRGAFCGLALFLDDDEEDKFDGLKLL